MSYEETEKNIVSIKDELQGVRNNLKNLQSFSSPAQLAIWRKRLRNLNNALKQNIIQRDLKNTSL